MAEKSVPRTIDSVAKDAINILDHWLSFQTFIRRFPGASFALVHDGKMVFSNHYGCANLGTRAKANDQTLYRIASISKMFTAVSLLQLVEKKKLRLDDPVTDYLQWFNSKNKEADAVTIRHLLFHCSGMNRETFSNIWVNDHFPKTKDLQRFMRQKWSSLPVLDNFKYSNVGFSILGKVIESASGKPFAEYVQKNILDPLNMKHTFVDYDEKLDEMIALGYDRDIPNRERKVFKQMKMHAYAPAAGFVSSTSDLCTFISALMDGDTRILSDVSKREMRRVQWVKDDSTNWGLGTIITKRNSTTIYGHSGGCAGFSSLIGFNPETKWGVVLLANTTSAPTTPLGNNALNFIHYVEQTKDAYTSEKSFNPRLYEGRFSEWYGELDVRPLHKTLVVVDPSGVDPAADLEILAKSKKGHLYVKKTDGYSFPAERVHFKMGKDGKPTQLLYNSFAYSRCPYNPDEE